MGKFLTIETAANLLGVCKQTLRRWDESGKLVPTRGENGYRQYTLHDIESHMPETNARPFLKWAGGKTQLLPELIARMPASYEDYIEPFLGGGALFFAVKPSKAKLNDVNSDLINCYIQVRDNPGALLDCLYEYQKQHSSEFYYQTREKSPRRMNKTRQAARFIYLNRTCFNGLYRVNRQGNFNVPIGNYKNPKIVDEKNIIACSNALENVELFSMNYMDFIKRHVGKDSFVYLDPPYIPVSKYSDFDRYSEAKFRVGEHQQLSEVFADMVDSGLAVLLSNSSSELSFRLYGDFKIDVVKASRQINNNGAGRGKIDEVIVLPKREREKSFPTTRYMGSKSTLVPHIKKILAPLERGVVLDAFSGSGVVSYHLKKMGFQVISNDFMSYSSTVATALIENNNVVLEPEDINMLLSGNRAAKKFVQTNFRGLYFSDSDNKFIDNAIANIGKLECRFKKAIALSALSRACLKRRPRGIFTYVGFKYDDGRKDLSFSLREHFLFAISDFNKAVFDNGRKNLASNLSALDLEVSNPDVIYLDPPYFSKHSDNDYVRRYHFIEGICRNWEGVEIQENTKTKKFKRYPSPFDTELGANDAFKRLIQKFNSSALLISYSSNSRPTKAQIGRMLDEAERKYTLFEIDYKYSFGNQSHKVRSNNNDVKEYLFYAPRH